MGFRVYQLGEARDSACQLLLMPLLDETVVFGGPQLTVRGDLVVKRQGGLVFIEACAAPELDRGSSANL